MVEDRKDVATSPIDEPCYSSETTDVYIDETTETRDETYPQTISEIEISETTDEEESYTETDPIEFIEPDQAAHIHWESVSDSDTD
jgi:hypothetical protein